MLKYPTERDLQTTVGPSALGNPCTRCLADAMLEGQYEDEREFWLGAVNGTAIHSYFGTRAVELREELDVKVWNELKVTVGEIPGYGEIKGSIDLFIISENLPIDLKTTTRNHLAAYKRIVEGDEAESLGESRLQFDTYLHQLTMYARGLRNAGLSVERMALVFLCRDGSGDNDIWVHEFDYDQELSDRIWNRSVDLWEYLQEGDADKLPSHKDCWYCNTIRPVRKEYVEL